MQNINKHKKRVIAKNSVHLHQRFNFLYPGLLVWDKSKRKALIQQVS